ncbi:hypothetical protein L228DRAFT_248286 [Xylona heveae TC161]|uniref:Uncharacterized protein n=1 Tax=Xylona heveae (strain CBS 132557 / TC161) TaxID=1328760 RepID=A0A165FZC8_XYLHT|nr:hypothetical protein L228DRAFT_248286 [Xylona heveae TC161]KZF21562.1 hypothetical protein L228DRAFT_248286 [Xylona heveae TC161]
MPRPKRTKVASSAPVVETSSRSTGKNGPNSGSSNTLKIQSPRGSVTERNVLEEVRNTNQDGRRRSRRSVFSKQELVLSGEVDTTRNADGQEGNVNEADEARENNEEQVRIGDSQIENDAEISPQDPVATHTPARRRGRPARTKLVQNTEHEKILEALRARREAAIRAQNEEIQVPSTPPEEALLGAATPKSNNRINSSVLTSGGRGRRAHGTPSMESSILAIANFKRRPRQPSILRMVQQDRDNQSGDDDEDDFKPDDESTPLNLNRTRTQIPPETPASSSSPPASQELPLSSGSRKRKLVSTQPISGAQEEGNVQVPRSSPREGSPRESLSERESLSPPPRSLASEEEDINQSAEDASPSDGDQQSHGSEIWSQTMAPPASSFLADSPGSPVQPQRPLRSKNSARQASRHSAVGGEDGDDDEDEGVASAAESSNDDQDDHEETPTRKKTISRQSQSRPRRAAASDSNNTAKNTRPSKSNRKYDKDPFAIPTATLQGLLPRRRRRRRGPGESRGRYDNEGDEFDIPSSGAEDNEEATSTILVDDNDDDGDADADADELARPGRPGQRLGANKNANKSLPMLAHKTNKSTQSKVSAGAKGTASAKTYGARRHRQRRAASSDKENDNDLQANGETTPKGNAEAAVKTKDSRELNRMKAKFQQVDDWALDFEAVTASSSPPSSGMAR